MLEPNALTLQVDPSDATHTLFGPQPASVRGSSSVELASSGFSLGRAGTIALLPDVVILILFLISPPQISLPLSGMIDDLNFLAPIPVRVDPSNSLMDGSAIGSLLPVLNIHVTTLRAVPQRG
jgi:hypothetical protein